MAVFVRGAESGVGGAGGGGPVVTALARPSTPESRRSGLDRRGRLSMLTSNYARNRELAWFRAETRLP